MASADMGVRSISTHPCSAGSEGPGQSRETQPVPGAGVEVKACCVKGNRGQSAAE